ncbi:hypothetical protein Ddye_019844 [Dipteronia dyeriana]|uniref:MULE transposase domain-containing protein n=1 Tax=Dipteronia dyeriana TaxID=168575 RepID=A0AAD9TYI9_9ROSI|nr:hypothetical protein Ddye_019844 [Dipteronia dyeriana]
MEKRVGGGTGAGGDTHVHKLPPSFFKPSSSNDTFIRVEQGAGVEDGIEGTKNCGGAGGVTFGGPSHDPFLAAPSRWILYCVGQYSFGTTPAAFTSQEEPLFVGQVFEDKYKLKIELGLYAMHERFDIRVRCSTKYRFEAGCASANVIGQLYAPKLSSGANICPKDIMRYMREKHGVELLYTKAWMAMQLARSTVYGKVDESYQFLPGYFHMLTEANPGTITTIETDEHNRFLYAFLSFRQSVQGFQSVIRHVVPIDATHLKSDYGGVMFIATCKDGTDMVYPLAFGFGDGETDEAWTWFLLYIRDSHWVYGAFRSD